jgi:hypothetical protein
VNIESGDINPNCDKTASCSTPVKPRPPKSRKFEEYGNIRSSIEKPKLDNFALQLQNDPSAQGYIVVYSGRTKYERGGVIRARQIKQYLIRTRKIDRARIIILDGPPRKRLTVELWIVPSYAAPPLVTSAP